jgi:hypothetical protein
MSGRERESGECPGDLSHVQVFPRASRRILIGVGNKRCSSRTVRVACRDKIFNGKNGKENLLEDAINSDETLINFGDNGYVRRMLSGGKCRNEFARGN